jgi:NADPH2:quinone reductase
MKVVDARTPGDPEVLQVETRPVPDVGASEVLIEVAAAGLNRADLLQRRGRYPVPPGVPSHPGLEVAGTIAKVGRDVEGFALGDRVCALLAGGGYAEYCAVDIGQVLPLPAQLTMVEGAALPEAFFTAFSNLFEFGRLQAGESVLIHGGSSGIGVAAIQLARAFGATVFTTAGSAEKCAFAASLGAHHVIDYKQADFVERVATLTQNRGVDVILDMIGGSYLARNVAALATGGRLVVIATQGGTKGELDVLRMMRQRLTITGSTLRNRSVEFKRHIRDLLAERVWPLIESGQIKPVVDRVFPLAQAADAHAYMESGVHMGKIVLQPE